MFVFAEPSVSSSMTPEFNEFLQNSQMLQSSLQRSLMQSQIQSPPVIINVDSDHSRREDNLQEPRVSSKKNPLPQVAPSDNIADQRVTVSMSSSAVPSASVSSYQIVKKNSNPSPLKGILVKNKNSRSMSSLAAPLGDSGTRPGMSSSLSQSGAGNGLSSRLNRFRWKFFKVRS